MLHTVLQNNREENFWHFQTVLHVDNYASGNATACPQIDTALLEI